MKRFLINLLVFSVLVILLDFVCGFLSIYLMSHAKGGSTQNNYYIAKEMERDVIILGSSRATHHYVPSVIENSTQYSCYNCGEEGNGSLLAYGRYKMATERYNPKVVIYEATPEYDFFADKDNSKYLKYLKPYYSDSNIEPLFEKFGNDFDQVKLISKMYQNNGLFLTEIIDNLVYRNNNDGYSPLTRKIDKNKNLTRERKIKDVDIQKIQLMEDLIIDCKTRGIKFLFFISPRYKTVMDKNYFDIIYSMANKNSIPIYDFRSVDDVSEIPEFFNDPLHMNNDGALYYTKHYVCKVLKNVR